MSDTPPNAWPNFLRAEIISLIIALLVQAAGLVWWGSQITSRVTSLEAKAVAAGHQAEDIARIDERTKAIDENVTRISRQLDGVEESKP